jgi:hypothetical protein
MFDSSLLYEEFFILVRKNQNGFGSAHKWDRNLILGLVLSQFLFNFDFGGFYKLD